MKKQIIIDVIGLELSFHSEGLMKHEILGLLLTYQNYLISSIEYKSKKPKSKNGIKPQHRKRPIRKSFNS